MRLRNNTPWTRTWHLNVMSHSRRTDFHAYLDKTTDCRGSSYGRRHLLPIIMTQVHVSLLKVQPDGSEPRSSATRALTAN